MRCQSISRLLPASAAGQETDGVRPAHARCSRRAATVLVAMIEVGLAQDEARRFAVALRQAVPHQHAAVAGIGHPQPCTVPRNAVGPEQRRCGRTVVAPVRVATVEVALAQDHVGTLMRLRRPPVPDQDPMVPGIGHRQALPLRTAGGDAGRNVHAVRAGAATRVAAFALERRLAEQDVRWRVVHVWSAQPAKHSVVSGIRGPQ
jgi:hypothetical protein